MANLGPRTVLPLAAANGLVINGNVIEIDPKGTIQFYDGFDYDGSNLKSKLDFNGLQIDNITDDNNSKTNLINAESLNIYVVDVNGSTFKSNSVSYQNMQIIDNIIGTNSNIDATKINLQPYYIDYQNGVNCGNGNGNIINLVGENTGAVTPSITKFILINISGIEYKLIIAQ
jgi:hypothetical protein